MWRSPSTIFVRDALYAGRQPLTKPTVAATNNETNIVGSVTFISAGIPIATGECVNQRISRVAPKTPNAPPATDKAMASPTNMDNTRWRVNPRAFSTATSRVRARIDMAMVLAETRRIANTTAPQMRENERLHISQGRYERESERLLALGLGMLRGVAEHFIDRLGDASHVTRRATCVTYHPACPLNQSTDSSKYLVLKYSARTGGSTV